MMQGAVEVVDRMKVKYIYIYTRVSNRWLLTIFCSFLNITGIISLIIYFSNTNTKLKRRTFLTDLAKQLTKHHMVITLNSIIRNKLGMLVEDTEPVNDAKPRYSFYPKTKSRFTQYRCHTCLKQKAYCCNNFLRGSGFINYKLFKKIANAFYLQLNYILLCRYHYIPKNNWD